MPTSLTPDGTLRPTPPTRKKATRRPNTSALAANLKRRGSDAVRSSLSSAGYDSAAIDSALDEAAHSTLGPSRMGPVDLNVPAPSPPAYDGMAQAARTGQGGGHDSAAEQAKGRAMAQTAMAGGGHDAPWDPAASRERYMERLTAHRLGLDLSNPDHAREFHELKWLTSQRRKQTGFYTGSDYRADYAAGLR